jgi:biotin carboxyl carrier protein
LRIDILMEGRTYAVDVSRERGTGARSVTIDGRTLAADVVERGGRWSHLIGHRSYDVAIERRPGGDRLVHVDGRPVTLTVIDGVNRRGAGAGAGARQVTAPMPGRIVKVLVNPGDVVAERQGLIVVEAMKMENELRAPRAGTVIDVRVREGASVEAHAVLVVIE